MNRCNGIGYYHVGNAGTFGERRATDRYNVIWNGYPRFITRVFYEATVNDIEAVAVIFLRAACFLFDCLDWAIVGIPARAPFFCLIKIIDADRKLVAIGKRIIAYARYAMRNCRIFHISTMRESLFANATNTLRYCYH